MQREGLFYVNEDLDPVQAEERKKFRELQQENSHLEEDKKLHIKFIKNRIVVNNKIVTPQVTPPTAADILRLTDEE